MIVDPKQKQPCPHFENGNCKIAEILSGLGKPVPVQEIHCNVCKDSEKPMGDNHVTASLAIGSVRQNVPRMEQAAINRLSPLLKRETVYIDPVQQYVKSTARWMAAGCPVRTDEETKEIMEICRGCPKFRTNAFKVPFCGQCGCYLDMTNGGLFSKARRKTEHCPLGKWGEDPTKLEEHNETHS